MRRESTTGSRARTTPAVALAVALAAWLAPTLDADARPGGGQSYSGGGGFGSSSGGGFGSSSDGSSDGGGELIVFLLRLCFEVPAVGIPLLVIVIVGFILHYRAKMAQTEWDTGPPLAFGVASTREGLATLRERDPAFSRVLFEDFAYRLYAQATIARADPAAMAVLAPYVAADSRAALLAREPTGVPIGNVVVGALRMTSVRIPDTSDEQVITIEIEVEANYTAGESGSQSTYYVVDRWTLVRAVDAVTVVRDGAERFPCPNCGAPFASSDDQTCEYCGEIVDNGRFDWQVRRVVLAHSESKAPTLTGTVAERGTDRPTVYQVGAFARWKELLVEDPSIAKTFDARVEAIFAAVNRAWNERDLSIARPFVSDGMYDYLRYWLEAYAEQGLHNRNDDARIERGEPAKLTRDQQFDALTMRIWGAGRDYTTKIGTDDVVGGSRNDVRRFSEYWTLIRGAGVRGAPASSAACPSCGAALAITMAGSCEHCGTHVTAGEFDWVLSKIEQDDSYRG